MADEPADKKHDWAVVFLFRLCVIGWLCAVFYEAVPYYRPLRNVFLLFGFWACVIALLHSLVLLFVRRQGIFFIFVLVAIPPTVHFSLVARNIAINKKIIAPLETNGEPQIETSEQTDDPKPTTPEQTPPP